MMMDSRKLASIALLMCFVLLPQAAMASKGVGIVWSTQTEAVAENARHCINYGVYNPWDEDVTAVLTVSDTLRPVITGEYSTPTFLAAGTMHDDAKQIQLCFYVPKVYTDDCLVGNMLFCEQTCSEPEVRYDGEVIVMEAAPSGQTGAMGSTTALGVSAPLTLRVTCNEYPRDYTIIIVGVVCVVAVGGYYYFRIRKKKK